MLIESKSQSPITPAKKGDNIVIIGRRWFDKTRGSTYFSAVGLLNGIEVAHIPYDYGYENHYQEEIFKILKKNGYITGAIENEPIFRYCELNGITLYTMAIDVSKRSQL